jgi:hypothetical protein
MAATDNSGSVAAPHRVPVGRIVLAVLGALCILASLGLGLAGVAVAVPYAVQRDADGYVTSDAVRLETTTYAVTSDEIDLVGAQAERRPSELGLGDLATVRLRVATRADKPVFVGIGREDDVQRYLRDVARAEIADIRVDPFAVAYRYQGSGAPSGPPGAQSFWTARVSGSGPQVLDWEPERGRWIVVVMNADGSAGVDVTASAGIKADWLVPLGIGLIVAALVLLFAGTALLVLGIVGIGRHLDPSPVTAAGPYPLRVEGQLDPGLSRGLWLVKWLLAIPHFIVLGFLWLAFMVLTMVAGVAILFTGRYPRSLFDFNVGVLRWTWRVGFYCFAAFGSDRYPPFTLGPAPEYPATLDLAYPDRLSRGLVLVKWWLLAIPHYIVVGIIAGGTTNVITASGERVAINTPGLLPWLLVVAVVVLLFTARYPKALFDLVMGLNRWVYRVVAYSALMTDEYPPFRLDQGGAEPDVAPVGATTSTPSTVAGEETS